eukprot:4592323-Pyramimonas_sp.AAC.1
MSNVQVIHPDSPGGSSSGRAQPVQDEVSETPPESHSIPQSLDDAPGGLEGCSMCPTVRQYSGRHADLNF